MSRRTRWTVAPLLLLAAGAALSIGAWTPWRSEPTTAAVAGSIHQVVVATGRVEPLTEIVLANKVPGRIKQVAVEEGDTITEGQALVLFDDAELAAQVAMAEASVRTAEAGVGLAERALETAEARWTEVKSGARPQEIERARADVQQAERRASLDGRERERFRRLVDEGHVARSQFDAADTEAEVAMTRARSAREALDLVLAGPKPETVQAAWAGVRQAQAELGRAESQVALARAALEHARAVLANMVVRSTVTGRVTKRMVEPGEAVNIGMPLLVLADVAQTRVRAEVDETDVGKLAVGQTVEITADAYPGRVFPGRVADIGQAVGKRKVRPDDPARIQDMKVLETKIDVLEGAQDLKLGMTVDVRIVVAHKDAVLLVPRILVPDGAVEATLRVAGARGIESRHVRLGARDDVHVEVLSGLTAGEPVVLGGRGRRR